MNRGMQKRIQTVLAAALTWLACAAGAAVPSSWLAEIPKQPYSMPVRARVKLDGKVLTASNGGAGSYIAAFYNGTLRGVAAFDDSDGYYFYNLTVRVASNTEKGYTFQFYNPATDAVTDCAETLDYTALGYGTFNSSFELVPQILTPKPAVVEPIVTITANDPTAAEGSTTDTGQFTITRKKADGTNSTSGSTTVNLKITGTATNGVDYTEITTTSAIASGKYKNTKTVKTLADSLVEGDETVVITILPGDGYSVGEQNTATVTIKDVPPAPAAAYTITTKASPAGSGTVTGAGTYAKGASVKLTATAGAGYKFVKWTKGTSTTSVSTANPYSFTASADATYVANFEATAVEPIVTITANDATATESSTTDTGQFTITRRKAGGANYTSGTTTVNLKITGTATNGVDYTEITTTSKIASGKYSNTKTVKTLADELAEGDETVVITILPGDSYSVGEQNTATVIIKDVAPATYTITTKASPSDSGTVTGGGTYAKGATVKLTATAGAGYKFVKWTKGTSTTSVSTANPYSFTASADATYVANFEATAVEPIVTITANDATATEGSTTDTGQFTITRKKADGTNWTSGSTTVNLKITGTATNGVDYTEITTTSAIASGKYQNTKTVRTLADSLTEGDETVVITILPGDGYSVGTPNTATVTIKDVAPEPVAFHPADANHDGYISGREYLNYTGIAKHAAVGDSEVVWDGRDVLSLERVIEPDDGRLYSRRVSTHGYGAGTLVTVTYTVSDPDLTSTVFFGDVIPAGWTVTSANGGILADGVLRFAFEYPNVPSAVSYTMRAPQSGLKDSYTLQSSADDTGLFTFRSEELVSYDFATALSRRGSFHPADTTQDSHISGLEYLAYSGAAKSIALAHCGYTWDGTDVLSLAAANGTRGAAANAGLARSVSADSYAAGTAVTVTLDIEGASGMAVLFIGEIIPAGWTVTDAAGGTVANGVLKFAFEAPAIPSSVSYTIMAPAVGLQQGCAIRSSRADTGCYAGGVIALAAEDTLLGDPACGVAFDEWPLQEQFYAADGGVFSWPAIGGTGSYLLTVYDAAGAVVAAVSVAGTSATLADLPDSASRWSVATDGMTSPEMALAQPAAVTGGCAAGTAVILAMGGDDGAAVVCDVLFYSAAGGWSSATVELHIQGGAARLELGQPAAGGYLCIRPQGAADYTEMFLE